LVAVDNLVDLILTCVVHPRAANQTFLVSDSEDLSTAELLRRIGENSNGRVYLLPVPVSILKIVLNTLGNDTLRQSLLGSLQVDITKTCGLLNWKPPVSLNEGLFRAMKRG
jgi:nucleoside-diphosphate-sugar epimerase